MKTGTDGITLRVRREHRVTFRPSASLAALRALGLSHCRAHEKFIPERYLRASIDDRMRLLQGLCDTDGFVVSAGKAVEYTTTSENLRDGIVDLVGGLGGYVTWSEKLGRYGDRTTRIAYRMILSFPRGDVVPVSSIKHLAKYDRSPHRLPERFIKSVRPIGQKICRCIAVESPHHLYVTDDFLVTHNTAFVMNVAVNVACPRRNGDGEIETFGVGVAIFTLEMDREDLATRMLCCEGRVDLGKMRQGFLQDRDWNNLTEASAIIHTLPIWIDDTQAIGLLEIRSKIRKLANEIERTGAIDGKGCARLGLVVVDYLQLMTGSPYAASREQEIAEISRGLKRLAKEFKVPVIALSQLNRAVETRGTKDKRPNLSDLRESGAIEQDADNVVFIYRDDYYQADSEQRGIAELIVAKQRNGPTGKVKVRFDAAYTRFDNLAPGDYDQQDDNAA